MVGLKIDLKKKKTPEWFDALLQSKFFAPCVDHQDQRKNEMNVFCIDCSTCGCQGCLILSHADHNRLQIRRYVYHDVIRLEDMDKHYDCRGVQPYILNGAKVIFLNPRIQPKQTKSNNGSSCEVCGRSLSEVKYSYCSIGCKVSAERDQRPRSLNFSLGSSSHETAEETQTTPESKLTELEESSSSVGRSSMSEDDKPQSQPISFRKRPRKQSHPRQAPFF